MSRKTQVALVSLLVLGACAQSRETIAVSQRGYRDIQAREITAELKIGTVVSGEKLGADERAAVKYFGEAFETEGHGALIISRPANGPDDMSALRAAADARAVLLAEGLDPGAIVEGPYDATGARSAPLVITYKTWEAFVPDCPTMSKYDFAFTGTNAALPSFGCAVNVSLAAQIANPGDLVGQQRQDPSDAGRRMIVMTKYRNGEVTGAARSQEASGAVSQAVN